MANTGRIMQEIKENKRKMEAITISIGATALKFLKITLPQNIKFFDNYIVATDSKDTATQEYCKQWPVTLVITDSFYEGGAVFNKGRVYNQIFQILKFRQWIKILDVDVFISDRLGKELREMELDEEYLYASRRVIAPKYYDFNMLLNWGEEYEKNLTCCFGIGYGFDQQFFYGAKCFKGKPPIYFESFERHAANGDWQFRNFYYGDISADAKEYYGNLCELKNYIWHLGEPCLDGGHKFFE